MTQIAAPVTPEPARPAKIRAPDIAWLTVWSRAVIAPAWRRAVAAWLGCAIVAAVLFGQTGMQPRDLTGLALHNPGVGLALAGTWLLIFAPVARAIVRAAPAAYLASLPHDPRLSRTLAAIALVALQLPWLALWITGEGLAGLAVVLAMTIAIAGLASWRPPSVRARFPAWRDPGRALRAIHLRALRRRAGDALIRGAGLALLAGAMAGLVIRNNKLTGETAGVLGAGLIAVIVIPAQIGTALVTLGAHRETAWLAASLGIAPRTRTAALVYAIAIVHLAATVIAIGAATAIGGVHGWLPPIALATALGTALGEARALLVHEDSPQVAANVVVSSVAVGGAAVVCLATLDAAGAIAMPAIGGFLLLTRSP